MHLTHATHAERGCVRALPHLRAIAERLDVHHDVRLGQRRLHRAFDGVGSCVPLADSGIDGDADHDVGEVAAGGLPHAQAPELDRRADVLDREACRLLRIGGHAVHQDVDVATHQPDGREEHEQRDEERRDRVGLHLARANEEKADEHRDRAGEVAREVKRVRRQRRASVRCGPHGQTRSSGRRR